MESSNEKSFKKDEHHLPSSDQQPSNDSQIQDQQNTSSTTANSQTSCDPPEKTLIESRKTDDVAIPPQECEAAATESNGTITTSEAQANYPEKDSNAACNESSIVVGGTQSTDVVGEALGNVVADNEKSSNDAPNHAAAASDTQNTVASSNAPNHAEAASDTQNTVAAVDGQGQSFPVRRKRAHRKCPHGRQKFYCRECGGKAFCEHGKLKKRCADCGGSGLCVHKRQKHQCVACGGSSICQHKKQRNVCRDCGGSGICQHNRIRWECKLCHGASICEHGRQRNKCVPCKGTSVCKHDKQRSHCRICSKHQYCEHQQRRGRCKRCRESAKPDLSHSGHLATFCNHGIAITECGLCKSNGSLEQTVHQDQVAPSDHESMEHLNQGKSNAVGIQSNTTSEMAHPEVSLEQMDSVDGSQGSTYIQSNVVDTQTSESLNDAAQIM